MTPIFRFSGLRQAIETPSHDIVVWPQFPGRTITALANRLNDKGEDHRVYRIRTFARVGMVDDLPLPPSDFGHGGRRLEGGSSPASLNI